MHRVQSRRDLWVKAAKKPDLTMYYEYGLVYVDGILCVSHNPNAVMKTIGSLYEIKNGDVSEHTRYLTAGIKKFQTPEENRCWSMDAKEYCKNTCNKVNEMLLKDSQGKGLPSKRDRHYPEKYRPEADITDELGDKLFSRYQQLIDIL